MAGWRFRRHNWNNGRSGALRASHVRLCFGSIYTEIWWKINRIVFNLRKWLRPRNNPTSLAPVNWFKWISVCGARQNISQTVASTIYICWALYICSIINCAGDTISRAECQLHLHGKQHFVGGLARHRQIIRCSNWWRAAPIKYIYCMCIIIEPQHFEWNIPHFWTTLTTLFHVRCLCACTSLCIVCTNIALFSLKSTGATLFYRNERALKR